MKANLGKAMGGFQAQARAHLASKGVDMAGFAKWAQVHANSALKAAMIGHFQNRDVSSTTTSHPATCPNLTSTTPRPS